MRQVGLRQHGQYLRALLEQVGQLKEAAQREKLLLDAMRFMWQQQRQGQGREAIFRQLQQLAPDGLKGEIAQLMGRFQPAHKGKKRPTFSA